MTLEAVTLYGRIFIQGSIRAMTGLHIGGAQAALAIGGVDNVVIRDALTGRPYIPGSSLRGKMRSLAEKLSGAPQNNPIGKGVRIHVASKDKEYLDYWVNPVFGVPAPTEERPISVMLPTRLIVRDVFMGEESAKDLKQRAQTDLPYTEVKWEAAIDRITSAATPRQMERVPAGAVFEGMTMIFSVFQMEDVERFGRLLDTLRQIEDDYLGGQGSRGSGQIKFENLTISIRNRENYSAEQYYADEAGNPYYLSTEDLLAAKQHLLEWLTPRIQLS